MYILENNSAALKYKISQIIQYKKSNNIINQKKKIIWSSYSFWKVYDKIQVFLDKNKQTQNTQ